MLGGATPTPTTRCGVGIEMIDKEIESVQGAGSTCAALSGNPSPVDGGAGISKQRTSVPRANGNCRAVSSAFRVKLKCLYF